jgi:saccharopine dehydrogenase-like NADP-dependent oxidoreductase
VISCLPHNFTMIVANLAHKLGLNYFDPTEDVNDTDSIRELAKTSKGVMIPQCGLAPGFVGIVGAQLIRLFDKNTISSLGLRVGALPLNPVGEFGYACNWSPEGLVNEYIEEAYAIAGSEVQKVPAGGNLEKLRIHGIEYEAFSTSGGLGTMTETYINEIDNLDYKSIRYPGHHSEMMRLFKAAEYNKKDLVSYMKQNFPPDVEDRVLVHVFAVGKINKKLQTKSFVADYRPKIISGKKREAIFWTTAGSIASVISLVDCGVLPKSGFVKQEEISMGAFLRTKHGTLFHTDSPEILNLIAHDI